MTEPRKITRIELVHTSDKFTDLKTGDVGTIVARRSDPWGEIVDVRWDNGSNLSLVAGEDLWRRITE